MSEPIVLVKVWPEALGQKEAAICLGVSESQFKKLVRLYPDKLRPFNLLPKGDPRWLKRTLDEFLAWREVVGVESA